MTLLTKAIACIGLGGTIIAGSGCSGPEARHSPMQDMTPQQRAQKEISDIQTNPNIPQDAKDRAIAAISAHSGGVGEAPGKKKK